MYSQQIKQHIGEKVQQVSGPMKSFVAILLFTMVTSFLLIFYVETLPHLQFSKGLKQPIEHINVSWTGNQNKVTALVTHKYAKPDNRNMLIASTFSYPIEEESFEAGDAIHAQLEQDILALSKKNSPRSFQGYTQVSAFEMIASAMTQNGGLEKKLKTMLILLNILSGILLLANFLRDNTQEKDTITSFMGLNVTLLNIVMLIGFLTQSI